MRIAYFSDNFYPELSGIVDSLLTTASELHSRGHEIIFVGPHYLPRHYAMVGHQWREVEGQEKIKNFPVLRLPSLPLPNSPTGQSRIAIPNGSAISFLKNWKPDIIHTNSPYGCGIEALRAAKKLNIPLIGTNHTPIEEYFPVGKTALRRFDAWYYNHCSFVSAPFGGLIEHMREVGFKKPGKGIPNPVIHTLFHPPTPDERESRRKEFDLNGITILYAGRLSPEKHIDVIVRAAAKLIEDSPNLKLVIAGHGAARENLELLAQELGVGEQIVFTGFLPLPELAEYYKAADIFAILSTVDTQSLSLMQAFACALPAVGARAYGLPDYIPEDAGFLVEPGDVEALTEKLYELCRNEEKRRCMGQAGFSFIQTLSPKHIADMWEEIYRGALT